MTNQAGEYKFEMPGEFYTFYGATFYECWRMIINMHWFSGIESIAINYCKRVDGLSSICLQRVNPGAGEFYNIMRGLVDE